MTTVAARWMKRCGARALAPALVLALLGGLAGCANYTLGSRAQVPFSSLSLLPVENDTQAAQMQALLHQQLSASLAQEKGVQVVTNGGQATLRVCVVRYDHAVSATNPNDTVLGSSFTLRLVARCTLVNNGTGRPYFQDREVTASAEAHDTGNFSAVEYQTMPVLTRELARKIKDTVVGVW